MGNKITKIKILYGFVGFVFFLQINKVRVIGVSEARNAVPSKNLLKVMITPIRKVLRYQRGN
jgi:hypothetical protein